MLQVGKRSRLLSRQSQIRPTLPLRDLQFHGGSNAHNVLHFHYLVPNSYRGTPKPTPSSWNCVSRLLIRLGLICVMSRESQLCKDTWVQLQCHVVVSISHKQQDVWRVLPEWRKLQEYMSQPSMLTAKEQPQWWCRVGVLFPFSHKLNSVMGFFAFLAKVHSLTVPFLQSLGAERTASRVPACCLFLKRRWHAPCKARLSATASPKRSSRPRLASWNMP